LTALLMAAMGCQSMPRPAPGMAALRVQPIGEPKAGSKPPADVSVYDSPSGPSLGTGAFERVDYSNLDQIVVWLEPAASASGKPAASPVVVDVEARKPAAMVAHVSSVGQRLLIRNRGAGPGNFYSVSDGNEFDVGTVPPGGQAEYMVKTEGLIEILSAAAKDPVAQIYAAPSRWVRLTRSGQSVDFTDLPPGRYRLISWHPRLPGTEQTVDLAPNQVAPTSIKVPKVGPK
jgi:hypothetical protein